MPSSTLTIVHKYIRRELFDLSQRLYRAAPDCIAGLHVAFEDVTKLLREHAAMEEARLVPLLRSHNSMAKASVEQDHQRLDGMLDDIASNLAALASQSSDCEMQLYQLQLDWDRFVALYLLHLDNEERTWFLPLHSHIPGPEHIAQSVAALSPERADEFLGKLWAVVTPAERTMIERARSTPSRRRSHESANTSAGVGA